MTNIIFIATSIMFRGLFLIINNFLRNNKQHLKPLAQENVLNNIFENQGHRDSSENYHLQQNVKLR